MPTYQYACTDAACGNEFELVQSFTDPAASECPVCQGPVRKVFSAVGVVFKGSGFYRTDSRAGSGKGSGGSSGAGGSGGSSGAGGTGGSKGAESATGSSGSKSDSPSSSSGSAAGSASSSSSSSSSGAAASA